MEVLNKITSDDLQEMGRKWAEHMFGDFSSDELKEFAYDTFINGFMAGAIQIRAIIEEFENEKRGQLRPLLNWNVLNIFYVILFCSYKLLALSMLH